MWRTKRVRGFTLIECLVALLVIAGSVQVYQGLTKILVSNVHHIETQERQEWLLFVQQMETELEASRLVKVEGDKLYIRQDNQELAFGLSKSDDFRKTNAAGRGYQPMLFDLSEAHVQQSQKKVQIDVTFRSGLKRSFVYAFDQTT